MRYRALATDYDGTIAHHGSITEETAASLKALKQAGRKVLLVTGRELPDLKRVCPMLDLFDRCVVENGAVVYTPATDQVRVLHEPPPPEFVETLVARGVGPISVGHVIVATWEPHEKTVLEVIHELGLEMQVIFNKGAVMILPSGVNKASGLQEALNGMCLSPHNVVGVGDAENDHALLALSECGVAVANALPVLKQRADITTTGRAGEGVSELIAAMIADDLASFETKLARHRIPLGDCEGQPPATLGAYGETVVMTGGPEAGKALAMTTLLEALVERRYQFCVIDPKGDYADFEHAVDVGDEKRAPSQEEVTRLLEKPERQAVINLSAVPAAGRPAFFTALMTNLWDLRKRFGRPHWIVINNAHLLMPADAEREAGAGADGAAAGASAAGSTGLPRLRGTVMVTPDLQKLAPAALEGVSALVAAGATAMDAITSFCATRGIAAPTLPSLPQAPQTQPQAAADSATQNQADAKVVAEARTETLDRDRAILWRPAATDAPRIFRIGRCRESRR